MAANTQFIPHYFTLIIKMQVAPPVTGKKMWRIDRASVLGASKNSSRECWNNSLKISAAGKQFLQKRPPSKRPRSKPGQPKDFIFVDLSPVKSSDDESTCSSDFSAMSSSLSANTSVTSSPTAMSRNDSLCSNNLFEEESEYKCFQSTELLPENELLGLGLLNLNYDFDAPQNINTSYQEQSTAEPTFASPIESENSFSAPPYLPFLEQMESFAPFEQRPQLAPIQTNNLYPTPEKTHKRARSVSTGSRRKSAGGIQFKTYKGPKNTQGMQKVHKRCLSESHIIHPSKEVNVVKNSLLSPLATPNGKLDDLNAFIQELEFETFGLSSKPLTQEWKEQSGLFSLSDISDIPEYSENPAMNYDFDATSFAVF